MEEDMISLSKEENDQVIQVYEMYLRAAEASKGNIGIVKDTAYDAINLALCELWMITQ